MALLLLSVNNTSNFEIETNREGKSNGRLLWYKVELLVTPLRPNTMSSVGSLCGGIEK